jgi:aspartate/methionine/tyrosine aminotransferase
MVQLMRVHDINSGKEKTMESLRELESRVESLRKERLNLDITRGKPGPEQLDLAAGMLTVVDADTFFAGSVDTRNYGGLDGIDEAKALCARYLGVRDNEVIIGGNSSLALMFDSISQLMTHGTARGGEPWYGKKTKFVCPVPGYDRHFTICEHFGIEMVTVPMNENGPDVDAVTDLVENDSDFRGMWCVPRFSNPTGYTCAPDVIRRLAGMKTAYPDFMILWDDAYAVHHHGGGTDTLESLLAACIDAGNPERPLIFGSTSKISLAGAGIAMTGGSPATCDWLRRRLFVQTIGYDKVNMLRHVLFFKDIDGIMAHMDKHASIIGPKFAAVDEVLSKEIGGSGIASWTKPRGGYFISLDTAEGMARDVIKLAGDLGVKLTPAGSTFPYKKDPHDTNIRIAPTFPGLEEVKKAAEVLAVCIKYVYVKKNS